MQAYKLSHLRIIVLTTLKASKVSAFHASVTKLYMSYTYIVTNIHHNTTYDCCLHLCYCWYCYF